MNFLQKLFPIHYNFLSGFSSQLYVTRDFYFTRLPILTSSQPKNWLNLESITAHKRLRHTSMSSMTATNMSYIYSLPTLHKKWSFPLRISSVNVAKSVVSCLIWSHLLKKSLMESFIFCTEQLVHNCTVN